MRADLIDSIENIQPDALLVKNDEGKNSLDLLAQSLEEKAISVRKKFKPSASEPSCLVSLYIL